MIYFTSDLHFCHNKDFLYEPRGFKSVEDMNIAIVERWNSKILNEDTIYVLGDLMLCDDIKGMELLKQLNGHIVVIRGNHDSDIRIKRYKEETINVDGVYDALQIKYGKATFFLCHYPVMVANFDDQLPWAKHLINLYGHTHQKDKFYNGNPYMYNVALDAHDCFPISIEEIIQDIKKEKEKLNNEKQRREKNV